MKITTQGQDTVSRTVELTEQEVEFLILRALGIGKRQVKDFSFLVSRDFFEGISISFGQAIDTPSENIVLNLQEYMSDEKSLDLGKHLPITREVMEAHMARMTGIVQAMEAGGELPPFKPGKA